MKVKVNNSIPQTSFTGIYNSKMLKKGLEFAAKNSSLFTATVSLGFSTAARPADVFCLRRTFPARKPGRYDTAVFFSRTLWRCVIMKKIDPG